MIGDDTNTILCLDDNWKELKRIELFSYPEIRIPKPEKPDLECAAIAGNILYILGSGSRSPQRDVAYFVNLQDDSVKRANIAAFYNLFRDRHLIAEMNIEGFTVCKDKVLFFNRGNTQQPNHLFIADKKILTRRFPDRFKVIPVNIGQLKNIQLGISGACYDEKKDILFITASAENTNNAYDDGEVAGSVLGVIYNADKKLDKPELNIDDIIDLEKTDKIFAGQKIESVCIIKAADKNYTLTLVSDNDKGNSTLFEVQLTL